eukprot:759809-Hanusia_phi.AAC.8
MAPRAGLALDYQDDSTGAEWEGRRRSISNDRQLSLSFMGRHNANIKPVYLPASECLQQPVTVVQ